MLRIDGEIELCEHASLFEDLRCFRHVFKVAQSRNPLCQVRFSVFSRHPCLAFSPSGIPEQTPDLGIDLAPTNSQAPSKFQRALVDSKCQRLHSDSSYTPESKSSRRLQASKEYKQCGMLPHCCVVVAFMSAGSWLFLCLYNDVCLVPS